MRVKVKMGGVARVGSTFVFRHHERRPQAPPEFYPQPKFSILIHSALFTIIMDKTVGVLGGGQLGRMLAEAANRLNIKLVSLDKEDSPTKQITAHGDHIAGSFKDPVAIRELAEKCDVLTVEIEHVDAEMLRKLETEDSKEVHPSAATIKLIQDKFVQHEHLKEHDIPVATFVEIPTNSVDSLHKVGERFGYPFMLKSRVDAYDGRGNFVVGSKADCKEALEALGKRPLYAEKWAPFRMELAVMVVRTATSTLAFPTVETIHENSICKLVYAPPRGVSSSVCAEARELAIRTISSLPRGKGIFAVEMFLLPDNKLLVNEIAPRPHNSGHYTIEGCYTSQYEAHLYAILDLPVRASMLELRQPSIMLNILGGTSPTAHLNLAKAALEVGAKVHL
jgi:phosphoribosylaminoimidazole carboxylase